MFLIALLQGWLSMPSQRFVMHSWFIGSLNACYMILFLCVCVCVLDVLTLYNIVLYFLASRVECFNEGLHSACCLWSTWNSSSECWIPCWCVHSLPHNTNQNGITLVRLLAFFYYLCLQLLEGLDHCILCYALFTSTLWALSHYVLCLRFCSRSLLRDSLDPKDIDRIPGRQNDRKTLLGELNWIFTAVTDTIAWNVLPHGIQLL